LAQAGGLKALLHRSPRDLAALPGLTTAKARKLLAAVELGRRSLRSVDRRPRLRTPLEIADFLRPHLAGLPHEEFHILGFNPRNVVLAHERISIGTADQCPVPPRDVYRAALRINAVAIVLAHNHPSGDPEPSPLDIELTRRLEEGARAVGIRILDHVVIGDSGYVSLLQRGLMSLGW